MKKTTIAFLIGSLFAITACSPSENTKPASNTATTATTAVTSTAPAAPATGNVTTSANLGSDVLATVNGHPISNKHVQMLIDMSQKASPDAPIDADMIKDNIITQEILAQEASRLKIDQTEEYKTQLEFMSKAFLTSLLYKDFIEQNPVTDAEIEKEYDFIKTQLNQAQEAQGKELQFQARHILVDSEDKAKEIIVQLNAGGNFADLAKANSIDPGSAQDGGSLGGWTTATVFVPEFAQALSGMKKGDTSKEAVKTQFGWHIISVDEVREVEAPKEEMPALSDHIKQQLREQLSTRKFLEYQEKLVQEASVVKGV